MPNALRPTKQGFVVGQAFLAHGKSVKQAVHDGDTVSISPNSFLNTRLLGVDTPEMVLLAWREHRPLDRGGPVEDLSGRPL